MYLLLLFWVCERTCIFCFCLFVSFWRKWEEDHGAHLLFCFFSSRVYIYFTREMALSLFFLFVSWGFSFSCLLLNSFKAIKKKKHQTRETLWRWWQCNAAVTCLAGVAEPAQYLTFFSLLNIVPEVSCCCCCYSSVLFAALLRSDTEAEKRSAYAGLVRGKDEAESSFSLLFWFIFPSFSLLFLFFLAAG